MNKEKNVVSVLYQRLYDFIMVICKLLLIADIGITSMAVVGRYVSFVPDPAWSEEIVLTCMIYMALLSAALAIKRCAHIRMTALDLYLPKIVIRILDVFGDLVVLAFSFLMTFEGFQYAAKVGQNSMYTSLPWLSKFWLYVPVGIAGVAMFLFQLEPLWHHIKALFGFGGES